MSRLLGVMIIGAVVLVSACASTRLIVTWHDENYNEKLHKVVVIGMSDNLSIRRTYEDTLSSKFKQQGVEAVASATLLPSGKKVTMELIKDAIKDQGLDAVLVTRVISSEKEQRYIPGTPYIVPHDYYYGFYNYFHQTYPIVYSPGYLVNDTIVLLETNIYQADEDGRLIWAATSETFNPQNINKEVAKLSDVIIKRLQADGLI